MEWYILDESLRRDTVIEGFESFIWTERYNSWGEFQIITPSTYDNRDLFQTDVRIGMKESNRVMKIESVTDQFDEDGKKMLTIVGREITKLLDERVAMPAMASLTVNPKWSITGTPGNIARYIFDQICVLGAMSPNDVIPFYQAGTFLPAGSIPEPTDVVTIDFDPGTVYYAIQQICQVWSLGFRLAKDGDTGHIYFDIYTGDDRTSNQTARPAVIFSMDMESIDKVSTLKSTATLKTVAYVLTPNGATTVYAPGHDSSVSGADRRVLLVKADDIDLPAGAQLDAAMAQRGMQELAKNRDAYAFDGEIPQYQPFVYGIDYNLGDLVEERSPDGFANYMIVTEQIFVSDEEGERAYPTLLAVFVLTPGSWQARPSGEFWGDVDITQHWDDA
jgi:Siphovirus ReqiPepy6 Gp37-like protein